MVQMEPPGRGALADLPPPVLGLTGAIAAGKSTAGDFLASMDCLVSRSVQHAHQILSDPKVIEALVDWWGSEILDPEGAISRPVVAKRVFADPVQRGRLESLVHPRIGVLREACFAKATIQTKALIIEAPLLFESGVDTDCDFTIFVDADRSTRLARAFDRGWDVEEFDRREAAQWSLDVKRQKADHVIRNEGALDVLRSQLEHILLHLPASE